MQTCLSKKEKEKNHNQERVLNNIKKIEEDLKKALIDSTDNKKSIRSIDLLFKENSKKIKEKNKLKDIVGDEKSPVLMFQEMKSLDYSTLFNYLGDKVKQCYEYSGAADINVKRYVYDKEFDEDFFNPKFSIRMVFEILKAAKMQNTYGVEVYVNPMKKSLFDSWKSGNPKENKMFYDMIMI